MYKSNREIIAENMPDDNTILVLRKDLQTRNGIITKGTRVNLCKDDSSKLCDCYKVTLSNDYDYCFCRVYLDDMIEEDGECILPSDVPKYPHRIQKFVDEYFTIDFDRTKEYKSYLEKRHINIGLVLFMIFWFVGLIAISIFGWLEDEWCNSVILPFGDIMTGILCNAFFGAVWCVSGIMGVMLLVISDMQSAARKNEKIIKKLLKK